MIPEGLLHRSVDLLSYLHRTRVNNLAENPYFFPLPHFSESFSYPNFAVKRFCFLINCLFLLVVKEKCVYRHAQQPGGYLHKIQWPLSSIFIIFIFYCDRQPPEFYQTQQPPATKDRSPKYLYFSKPQKGYLKFWVQQQLS